MHGEKEEDENDHWKWWIREDGCLTDNVVKNNVTLLILFVKWNKCVSMNKLEQMLHEAINIYIYTYSE